MIRAILSLIKPNYNREVDLTISLLGKNKRGYDKYTIYLEPSDVWNPPTIAKATTNTFGEARIQRKLNLSFPYSIVVYNHNNRLVRRVDNIFFKKGFNLLELNIIN